MQRKTINLLLGETVGILTSEVFAKKKGYRRNKDGIKLIKCLINVRSNGPHPNNCPL
jgi:hypothetical protein